MNLQESISKRKSTRKYDMVPLDRGILDQIKDFALTLKPLHKNIKVEYTFANAKDVKNILSVKAPHYIIISSENKDGYLTNVGFMFQQMNLYLSSIGLGSCWLGAAKPVDKISTGLEFVIILSFGKTLETPYREVGEFKRKSIAEISDNADARLEVARLAPSGINSQPWYFVSAGDKIYVYCAKFGRLKAMVYEKMNKIDMGIALAHLYVANTEKFEFTVEPNPKELKGYYYIGNIKI